MSEATVVGVVGAGTMGAGIAQVAATGGHPVRLYDAAPGFAAKALAGIAGRIDRLAEKGTLTPEAAVAAKARITVVDSVRSSTFSQRLRNPLSTSIMKPSCDAASN